MVDIAVEFLACSLNIPRENLRIKLKTWWAQMDVEEGKNIARLPLLPLIEQYYLMSNRDIIVFIEMWYVNDQLLPKGSMRFLGMAKCQADSLLQNPQLNPCVEWLEVYDPIENIIRGKILLKLHAKIIKTALSTSSGAPEIVSYAGVTGARNDDNCAANGPPSSYFITKQRIEGHSSQSNPSSADSSPYRKNNVPIQHHGADGIIVAPNGKTVDSDQERSIIIKGVIEEKRNGNRNSLEPVKLKADDHIKSKSSSVQIPEPIVIKVNGRSYQIKQNKGDADTGTSTAARGIKITKQSYASFGASSTNEVDASTVKNQNQTAMSKKPFNSTGSSTRSVTNSQESTASDFSLTEIQEVIHLINNNFDKVVSNSKPSNDDQENGKGGCTKDRSTLQQTRKSSSVQLPSTSTDILKKRSSMFEYTTDTRGINRLQKLSEISERRLAPEGQSALNPDDYKSHSGPSNRRISNDDLVQNKQVACSDITKSTTAKSSTHSKLVKKYVVSTPEDPSCGKSPRKPPPRSRRIAAAIFGDEFDEDD